MPKLGWLQQPRLVLVQVLTAHVLFWQQTLCLRIHVVVFSFYVHRSQCYVQALAGTLTLDTNATHARGHSSQLPGLAHQPVYQSKSEMWFRGEHLKGLQLP